MKWLYVLLGVLLLMPLASATVASDFAELRSTQRVALSDYEEVSAPPATGPTPLGQQTGEPTPSHTCAEVQRAPGGDTAPYLRPTNQTGTPKLIFYEPAMETGCAEARFLVPIPDHGADASEPTNLTLTYAADRKIQRAAGNVGTYAEQGVRFYVMGPDQSITDVDLRPFDCFGTHPTFDPGRATVSIPQVTALTFDLAACADSLGDAQLVLAFYFLDVDPKDRIQDLPPGLGQQFTATIWDVVAQFDGAQIPISWDLRRGSDPQEQLVGYLQARLYVPESDQGGQQVSFFLSNEWGIHTLYKQGPDGLSKVSASALRAVEADGILTFTLSEELLKESDYGEYVVVFTGPDTGLVKAYRIPFVAFVLMVPLLAGLIAQRNLNHLYRTSRGRLQSVRWSLQGGLVAAWSLYVGVAVTLAISSTGIGMAAWPLPAANVIAYALLGLTVASMVVVGVAARKRDMQLVLDDLSELERIQAELERSNRELEQFAYVASHDLKEPLRMVAGYTQLLEMRYGKKLDAQGKDYLLFAAEGSRRLQHMVDDLLAYSRVRSDQSTYKTVDLHNVMNIVQGHLKGLIQERGVRLVCDDLTTVHGDQGQLVQLLLNLIQNAIKFSPQDAPLVEVKATRDRDRFTISVRDEGIGISPTQQDRIFQIFQRLHLREEYEGNGIGLAMCKKIAEQMGGRITVASEPGKGATFTVVLPDLSARPGRGARPTEVARPRGRPFRADSPA